MDRFISKDFAQFISGYAETPRTIHHPLLGNFKVLENRQGVQIIKKTITAEQFSRFDVELFEAYERMFSSYVLQFKGITKEKSYETTYYSIYYEHFDETLKEEIEKKVQDNQRYSSQEILGALKNIVSALSYMQNCRLVHGEIKSDYIVRVGHVYKLINPIIFGRLSHFHTEHRPVVPRHPPKTVSPDIINAIHRDIVDPVHEDFKDDVYGLGLVALELMILRIEAPIPIEKKIERASFFYPNALMRVVKKMVETILTLRLDPLACGDFIERIKLDKHHDQLHVPTKHYRTSSMTTFQMNQDKERLNLSELIMKDSEEANGLLFRKQNPSQTRVFKGCKPIQTNFYLKKGVSSNEIVPTVSISLLEERNTSISKDSPAAQLSFLNYLDYHNSQDREPRASQEKEADVTQIREQYTNFMKGSGSMINSKYEGSLRGGRHVRSGSATYSVSSTNSTYYSRPRIREGAVETKANISDILYLSGFTRENMETPDRLEIQKETVETAELESGGNNGQTMGNSGYMGHTVSSAESKHEEKSGTPDLDITEFVNKVTVVPVPQRNESSSASSNKSKSPTIKETEGTPRFKEKEKCLGKIINNSSVNQSRIVTSRRLYKGPEKVRRSPGSILCTINLDYSSNIQNQSSASERDSIKTLPSAGLPVEKVEDKLDTQADKANLPFSGKRILKVRTKSSGNFDQIVGIDTKSRNHEKSRKFVQELESYLDNSKDSSFNTSYMMKKDPLESKSIPLQQLLGDHDLAVTLDTSPLTIEKHSKLKKNLKDDSSKRLFSDFKDLISEKQESGHKEPHTFEPVNLKNYFSENILTKVNSQSSLSKPKAEELPLKKLRNVIERLPDGTKYEGEMLGNKKQGHGKLTYLDNTYYEGDWNEDKISGFGILYSNDGVKTYEGYWQDGKYQGKGILTNSRFMKMHLVWESQPRIPSKEVGAWIKYKGEFNKGEWEGFGELLLANGDQYSGGFKNNKTYGRGRYTTNDGRVWEGEWQFNYMVKATK